MWLVMDLWPALTTICFFFFKSRGFNDHSKFSQTSSQAKLAQSLHQILFSHLGRLLSTYK